MYASGFWQLPCGQYLAFDSLMQLCLSDQPVLWHQSGPWMWTQHGRPRFVTHGRRLGGADNAAPIRFDVLQHLETFAYMGARGWSATEPQAWTFLPQSE